MPRWLFHLFLLLLLLLHFDFSENAHNKFMRRRLSPGSVGSPLAAAVAVVAAAEGVCFLYFICQRALGVVVGGARERTYMRKVIP